MAAKVTIGLLERRQREISELLPQLDAERRRYLHNAELTQSQIAELTRDKMEIDRELDQLLQTKGTVG